MKRGRLRNLRSDERGVAIVFSLILMLTLSILAASLTFLAQTETYGSVNYRQMTQARYGAESGIHKAANFLLNTYVPPGGAGDPMSNYDTTVSPVTYLGQPVVLSAMPTMAANYPIASAQDAFTAAAQGTLPAGNATVSYTTYATMVSMVQASNGTAVTWEITSDGQIAGSQRSLVEVSAVLERQVTVAMNQVYAAFALAGTCGALNWNSASTDSYDSTAALVSGRPVVANNNGNVGTNGNLDSSNSAVINGTLSTPRIGVGSCSSGNVTAQTSSGGATVTGGIVHLSQAVSEPTPPTPNPAPSTIQAVNVSDISTCGGVAGCTRNGDGSKTYAPGTYGNFNVTNDGVMHFSAGTYNINSVAIDNHSQLILDSGPVTLNVVGSTGSGTGACGGFACLSQPYWLNSSTSYGPSFGNKWDPTQFTLTYAGTGLVRVDNEGTTVQQIDAPNARVLINSSNYYGSVVGSTITFGNAARLHFDRHLGANSTTHIAGANMLTSFTWKKG